MRQEGCIYISVYYPIFIAVVLTITVCPVVETASITTQVLISVGASRHRYEMCCNILLFMVADFTFPPAFVDVPTLNVIVESLKLPLR